MRKVLLVLLFVLFGMISYSQTKYPIKTIFRGDSVVILTIQQSDNINKMIEKNSRLIKENNAKVQEYVGRIKVLEQETNNQKADIDSLSNALLECLNSLEVVQYNSDTLLKQYDELNLTI